MKALTISGLMLLLVCSIGYVAHLTAQEPGNTGPGGSPGGGTVTPACALTDAEVQDILNQADDTDDNAGSGCCGTCNGETIVINGTTYTYTVEKEIAVCALVKAGITNPNCWLAAIRISGNGHTGTQMGLNIETQEGAPSHIQLHSIEGNGTQFPASVHVRMYANLIVEGLPVLYGTEQIELQATTVVNQWPPKGEVVYKLMKPAAFQSADGKNTATINSATVTMRHKGETLALH